MDLVETSILSRQGDILKQHKLLAYIRRNIMPGYHVFFVANGEKAPSGKLRDDAIKAVLEHLWKQLEEDRVEKLAKKAAQEAARPTDVQQIHELNARACQLASHTRLQEEGLGQPEPANLDAQPEPQSGLVAQGKAALNTTLRALGWSGKDEDKDDAEDTSNPSEDLGVDDPKQGEGWGCRSRDAR
jgi:hypothetical protein